MTIQPSEKYLLIKKCVEKPKEVNGFVQVEVHDSFVYRGEVVSGDDTLIGKVVIFAKYSPDTHEVDVEGEKMKLVLKNDVIAYEL